MHEKVTRMGGQKYRNGLVVVRGDLYATLRRKPRRQKRVAPNSALQRFADREFHAWALRLVGPDGTVVSEAVSDMRRHRQRPHRPLVRRIWEAVNGQVEDDALDDLKARVAKVIDEAKRQARQSSGNPNPPRAA